MTIQDVVVWLAVFIVADSILDACLLVYLVARLAPRPKSVDEWHRDQ